MYVVAGIDEQKLASVPPRQRRQALQEIDRIYEQLERTATKMNDPAVGPSILVNRARIALALGDAVLAESRLRKALTSMEGSGSTARVAYAEQWLGRALLAQHHIDEAISYFSSSVNKAKEAKQPDYAAMALMSWASAEAARSNQSQACLLAQEAYSIMQEVPEMGARHQQAEQMLKQFCR